MISGASIDRCVRILLTTFYHMHHYTMQLLGRWSRVHYHNYVQSPNSQIDIRPRDEVIMTNDDETYDEMMMKPMMKLGENCFKMFSSHERVLGPRIRT